MKNKLLILTTFGFAIVFLYSFLTSDAIVNVAAFGKKLQTSVRLYVFDGGTIENNDLRRYRLESNEVAINRLSDPCYLIVHPKGTLIWDTGAVHDSAWTYTGSPVLYKLIQPNVQRDITLTKPIKMQLAAAGYSPSDIKYIALSHYHYDHTANANEFSNATWLVRQNERDSMFAKQPPPVTIPSTYSGLRNNKTEIITTEEFDVFGDGSVIIKSAPGHTPGHQALFVRLKNTGNIVLSGDLYHFPEEKTLDRVPIFDFNQEQNRASRRNVDDFLKAKNAQLWIQHDFGANSKLKKAPAFYD
jgi:glyoxylase-like metal-dependent hydrolase (beta-lactamase superfamily II)